MTAKSKRGVSAIDFNVKGQIETEAAMAEWHIMRACFMDGTIRAGTGGLRMDRYGSSSS